MPPTNANLTTEFVTESRIFMHGTTQQLGEVVEHLNILNGRVGKAETELQSGRIAIAIISEKVAALKEATQDAKAVGEKTADRTYTIWGKINENQGWIALAGIILTQLLFK